MNHLVRTNAILSFVAENDLTGREGFPVFTVSARSVALIDDPEYHEVLGVLLSDGAAGEEVSVAVCAGLAGTVKVKLAEAVSRAGIPLKLAQMPDGDFFCAAAPTTLGARLEFAVALEPGAAGELIEAALFQPRLILN